MFKFFQLKFLLFLGFLFFLCACGIHSDSVKTEIKNNSTIVCSSPLLVSIAVDQSGSMKWSGTPQVTIEDLTPLIAQLNSCGGEIGVAFVRDKSNFGIERLLFPELPPPLIQPVKKGDEENYEFDDRLAEYHQKQLDREKLIESQTNEMKSKIEIFLVRIKPLLEKLPKGGTDFNTTINRADVFLSENDSVWQTKPKKFLIVVSDAIDTKKQTKNPFKSDAKVLWVNATTNEKNMSDLKFDRFESFAAAVRFITQEKEERSKNDGESK